MINLKDDMTSVQSRLDGMISRLKEMQELEHLRMQEFFLIQLLDIILLINQLLIFLGKTIMRQLEIMFI